MKNHSVHSLPNYAGESDIFELYDLLAGYYSGQGDPIYRVISMRDPSSIGSEEISAIRTVLEMICDGRIETGGSPPEDCQVAANWLPVITEIDDGERVCLGCGVTICGSDYCDKCEED